MAAIVSFLLDDQNDSDLNVIAYAHAEYKSDDIYRIQNAYNSTLLAATGQRVSEGNYVITFAGQNFSRLDLSFQVSATRGSASCSLGQSEGDKVSVYCYDPEGLFVDSQYIITVSETGKNIESSARIVGYGLVGALQMEEPNQAYDLPYAYSYSLVNEGITSTNTATGKYTITLPGLDLFRAVVHVEGSNLHICNSEYWLDNQIFIECYDSESNPVNSTFSFVAIMRPISYEEVTPKTFAYANATQPNTDSYVVPKGSYFNSNNRPVKIERFGTGRYSLEFSGPNSSPNFRVGVPMVTSASINRRCQTGGWDYISVFVYCRTPAGTLVDARFSVHYFRDTDAVIPE
jgi:hypothetical protein